MAFLFYNYEVDLAPLDMFNNSIQKETILEIDKYLSKIRKDSPDKFFKTDARMEFCEILNKMILRVIISDLDLQGFKEELFRLGLKNAVFYSSDLDKPLHVHPVSQVKELLKLPEFKRDWRIGVVVRPRDNFEQFHYNLNCKINIKKNKKYVIRDFDVMEKSIKISADGLISWWDKDLFKICS
jgi:hypothetical protein